jgi:hypothetical protein
MKTWIKFGCVGCLTLALAACGDSSKVPEQAAVGPDPKLPSPQKSMLPTVHIASAKGWSEGRTPQAASGLTVKAFATGLQHPRWLLVLPNGDVLVAESDGPERPAEGKGIKGWIYKAVQRWAGSGTKSADRITLLRDKDGDGVAETRSVFVKDLHSPFGMALVGHDLYVANANAIVRFGYQEGATAINTPAQQFVPLPGGPINHHWTKNIVASRDGTKLYAAIGSNSNAGENGLDKEAGRAAIWEVDPKTGEHRIFASGIRNPNGLGWSSDGKLWTAVNERDEIGGDLVPDYMTSVKDGAFYGWPWSYYGQHVDTRVTPANPEMVAKAIPPDYALGTHTASLGLAFAKGARLGDEFSSGVFIGQHGSWNRKPVNGYDVIFVKFDGGKPIGQPTDVLTGFLNADGDARGRPVGVAIDKQGALLVADDTGNVIWRVTKQ